MHHPLSRDGGEHRVQVQGMYGVGEVGGRSGRPYEDDGKPEAGGHRTGTGRNKWRNGGSRGNVGRSEGGEKCVGEKTRDNSSTEESEVKKICSGTPIIATHSYRKNQDSPLGKELYLQQVDTLSYILEHEDMQRTLVASGIQQRTGGIRASVASDDHHGRDDSGRGM